MSIAGPNEPLDPSGAPGPDFEGPSTGDKAANLAGSAISAGKEIAAGAATGGQAGAAKAAIKIAVQSPKGRKMLVGAIVAVCTAPIAMVVAMSMMISFLLTTAADTKTSIDMALRQTVAAAGFSEEEMTALIQSASDHNLSWEMMAAILEAQRWSFDGVGPFHIPASKAKQVPRPGATDLTASAQWVAGKLQALTGPAGVDLNLDIGSGATIYANKKIVWNDEEQHDLEVVDPWSKAVEGLPLEGATESWSRAIVEQAVKWRLGIVDCAAPGFSVSGDWVQPTIDADGKIGPGNDYGWRIHPISKAKQFHKGDDIGNNAGTPIWAAAAGTVVRVGYSTGTGHMVKLDHGGGIATEYFHMDQNGTFVKVGDKVTVGQKIAQMGDTSTGQTGSSTSPHLHFQVLVNGATTDPVKFFAQHGLKLTDKPPMADGGAPPAGGPGTGTLLIGNGGETVKFRTGRGNETVEFNKVMLKNAQIIANTINTMVPKKGTWTQMDRERLFIMAVQTGMAESTMGKVFQAPGNSHVGIFQQSSDPHVYSDAPTYQGRLDELRDVVKQTNSLVQGFDSTASVGHKKGLVDQKNWRSDKTAQVITDTQINGGAGVYQKWEALAKAVLAGLNGTLTGATQAGCTDSAQLAVNFANIRYNMSGADWKADLAQAGQGADILILNEAGGARDQGYIKQWAKQNDFTINDIGNFNQRSNTTLWRSSLGSQVAHGETKVCRPFEGLSARYIAWVTISMGSQLVTVINTHAPPTIESGGKPTGSKVRRKCAVDLINAMNKIAKEKSTVGPVIAGADMNINYVKDKQEKYSKFPYHVLEHDGSSEGLRSQFTVNGMQSDGTHGDRYIDYIYYWAPGSTLTPSGYKIHEGQNSDHNFVTAWFGTGQDDIGAGEFASIIDFALKYERAHRVPYSWGGGGLNGPTGGFGKGAGIVGFDCSSWVRFVVYQGTSKQLTLPRTAAAQASWAQKKGYAIRFHDWRKVKAGDLVFYASGRGTGRVYHVALAIGDGKIIEEPGTGRYIQVNPLSPDRQPWDIWGVARWNVAAD